MWKSWKKLYGVFMLWTSIKCLHRFTNLDDVVPVYDSMVYGIHYSRLAVVPALFFALMMTLNFKYKWSAVWFAFFYGYCAHLDIKFYNNHYYLEALLSFIIGVSKPLNEKHNVVRMILMVYFFAGLAKLDYEWVGGDFMRGKLAQAGFFKLVPSVLCQSVAILFSLGGIVVDIGAAFTLSSRNTRVRFWGILMTSCFHVTNKLLFGIGLFPWMMLCSNVLFVKPLRKRHWAQICLTMKIVFMVQLLLPLRYLVLGNDPDWDGIHKFNSWRMMKRSLDCDFFNITVVAPNGFAHNALLIQNGKVEFGRGMLMLDYQQANRLCTYPSKIPQIARRIVPPNYQVFADAWVSMNLQTKRPILNPFINYRSAECNWHGWCDFIVPRSMLLQ